MPRVLITDHMGDDTRLEQEILAAAGHEVVVAPAPDPTAWIDVAVEADGILTRHAPLGAETVGRLERCRIIARYGTGHDNVDVEAAERRGIAVTIVPGYSTDEVADHAFALLLALVRRLDVATDSVRAGGWTPHPLPPVHRLRGRTLGLLGCGRIGAAMAVRATGFGLDVVAYDPFAPALPDGVARAADVDELCERSDILSLHAPLTPDTHHVVGASRLARLPRGAILLNVARGGLLDLDAALRAIESGRLHGLAVDVTEVEPPPAGHRVRRTPGVICTPHLGYYSTTSVEEAKRRSAEEVVRVLAGERPRHPITAGPVARTAAR